MPHAMLNITLLQHLLEAHSELLEAVECCRTPNGSTLPQHDHVLEAIDILQVNVQRLIMAYSDHPPLVTQAELEATGAKVNVVDPTSMPFNPTATRH